MEFDAAIARAREAVAHPAFDMLAVAHEKRLGIDDHRGKGRVAVEAQLEDGLAGEQRNADTHGVVQHEATRGLQGLLVQKEQREIPQAAARTAIEIGHRRRCGDRGLP